jgi:hypothetical protein
MRCAVSQWPLVLVGNDHSVAVRHGGRQSIGRRSVMALVADLTKGSKGQKHEKEGKKRKRRRSGL